MKLFYLIVILSSCLSSLNAQNIIPDCWFRINSGNTVFHFSNPDSLHTEDIYPDPRARRPINPFKIEDSNYIITYERWQDTIKIKSEDKYKKTGYSFSRKEPTILARGNDQLNTDSLIHKLKSSDLILHHPSLKNSTGIILKNDHFLRNCFYDINQCHINYPTRFNVRSYGLVVSFSSDIYLEVIIGDIYYDKVTGICEHDGSYIEISYAKEDIIPKIEGSSRDSLIGTFIQFKDSITLFEKLKVAERKHTIHIGYPALTLNKNGTYSRNNMTTDYIDEGMWEFYQYRNHELLILKSNPYGKNKSQHYSHYFIEEKAEKHLITKTRNCGTWHGRYIEPLVFYYKKL